MRGEMNNKGRDELSQK